MMYASDDQSSGDAHDAGWLFQVITRPLPTDHGGKSDATIDVIVLACLRFASATGNLKPGTSSESESSPKKYGTITNA